MVFAESERLKLALIADSARMLPSLSCAATMTPILLQVILGAEEMGLQYIPKYVEMSKQQQFEPEFVVSCALL